MEDDKLKSLFSNFEPEITPDQQFMNRLEKSLNSVEIIKQHSAEVQSKHKKAMIIAAFVGFIVGVIFSLSLPYLSNSVTNWQLSLPQDSSLNIIADNFAIIAWIMIGGASVITAIKAYHASFYLLKPNDSAIYQAFH